MVWIRSNAKVRAVGAMAGLLAAGLLSANPAMAGAPRSAPTGTTALAPSQVSDSPAPGWFVPVSPARLLDTRIALGAPGPVKANSTVHLKVTGKGGVPTTGVAAVVLNLTVTVPTRNGHLTAYPDGTRRPTASNLNYVTNQTVANLAIVKVGTNGKVALHATSPGQAQLVGDVSGYYVAADGYNVASRATTQGTFVALPPSRIVDSRIGLGVGTAVGAHKTAVVQVAGAGGVPATGAEAVVLNVTVTQPTRRGYLTVYQDQGTRPLSSTLDFAAGRTVPNLATVALSPTGAIDVYNASSGTIHLVADVAGYYLSSRMRAPAVRPGGTSMPPPPGGTFVPLPPQRLVDTRSGLGATGPVPARGTITVPALSKSATAAADSTLPPNEVVALVVNITVTQPRLAGYLTAYPGATSRPQTSTLNFVAGQTVANMAMTAAGTDGTIAVTSSSSGTVQIIVDIVGVVLSAYPV